LEFEHCSLNNTAFSIYNIVYWQLVPISGASRLLNLGKFTLWSLLFQQNQNLISKLDLFIITIKIFLIMEDAVFLKLDFSSISRFLLLKNKLMASRSNKISIRSLIVVTLPPI
jgi:hypothetical protein